MHKDPFIVSDIIYDEFPNTIEIDLLCNRNNRIITKEKKRESFI